MKGETEIVLWQLSTYIYMYNINVSLNEHHSGSLISITNRVLYLEKNSTYMYNGYYENILMLHLSTAIFRIMEATSGSYFIMRIGSAFNITNNIVYNIIKQVHTFEGETRPLCPIQFLGHKDSSNSSYQYYYDDHLDEINVQIYMLNNVLTVSKGLLIGSDLELSIGNCTWLANSAFQSIDAALVYKMVFRINHIIVNKNSTRKIPLSVCPCSDSSSNCYSPNLNYIYPGQTLHVSLIVHQEKQQNPSTTLVVANTQEDDCSITESYQLSQTYLSHGCNN